MAHRKHGYAKDLIDDAAKRLRTPGAREYGDNFRDLLMANTDALFVVLGAVLEELETKGNGNGWRGKARSLALPGGVTGIGLLEILRVVGIVG